MPATAIAAPDQRRPYDGMRMPLAEFEALDLDEIKPYLEWWDGIVLQKPMPNRRHRNSQREFVIEFGLYCRIHGGTSGPEGHVWFEGRGYRVPDVAYWSPDRDEGDDRRLLPPTLVVEVASPRQVPALREKCRERGALGVDVCWLADPVTRTVEVFDATSDGAVFRDEDTLTSPLLPGLALRVASVFPLPA